MDENTNVTQTETGTATNGTEQVNNTDTANSANDAKGTDNTELSIEELIQRAVDRATNKLGNENKKLRDQNETLKREKLTDAERKQLEIADREADIADREAKLKERENRLFTIKAIKEAGLDDGSANALELVDFVMTDEEETTTARVKAFSALVKKFVSAEVDRTFKANGRNVEKGGTGKTENPTNNLVENLGKATADRNAAANKVLNHYLGEN